MFGNSVGVCLEAFNWLMDWGWEHPDNHNSQAQFYPLRTQVGAETIRVAQSVSSLCGGGKLTLVHLLR